MKNYCYNCMNEITEGNFCPYCHSEIIPDNVVYRLRPGTILNKKFLIGNCLGEGGFGITYIGRDLTLDRRVAVKEYFPNGYVTRNNSIDQNVTATTEQQINVFRKGLQNFLEEARNIARLTDVPGIVDVREYFEENGTAYIIMDYLDGVNLSAYLKKNGVFKPETIFTLMLPITYSLQKMHESGIIHRDISPDNIMYLNDGKLILTDFGSARYFSNSQKEMSVMLKQGYAPEEQYSKNGDQGPWTDVYGLCATLYKCITGRVPADAIDRIKNDTLIPPSELGVPIPEPLEITLMYGLAVFKNDRCKSMQELSLMIEKALANENIHVQSANYYNRLNQTMIANGTAAFHEDFERSLNHADRTMPANTSAMQTNYGNQRTPDPYRTNTSDMNTQYRGVDPRFGSDPNYYRNNGGYNTGYTQNDYEQQETNKTPLIIAITIFLCVTLIAGTVIFLYVKFGMGSDNDLSVVETEVPATASPEATVGEETFTPPPTEPPKETEEPQTQPPETTEPPTTVTWIDGMSATASNRLNPQQGHHYDPKNVLSKDGTCWCPKEGSGVDEWIRIDLDSVSTVSSIDFINGYVGNETQYKNNGKAKKIKVEFSNGSSITATLTVCSNNKRNTVQTLTFDPVQTDYVKVTILSIEEGEKFKDTCISYIHPNKEY